MNCHVTNCHNVRAIMHAIATWQNDLIIIAAVFAGITVLFFAAVIAASRSARYHAWVRRVTTVYMAPEPAPQVSAEREARKVAA